MYVRNVESDNRESDNEHIQQSSSAQDDLPKDSRTNSMDIVSKRRAGIRFTMRTSTLELVLKNLVLVGQRYCIILTLILMHVVFQIL